MNLKGILPGDIVQIRREGEKKTWPGRVVYLDPAKKEAGILYSPVERSIRFSMETGQSKKKINDVLLHASSI